MLEILEHLRYRFTLTADVVGLEPVAVSMWRQWGTQDHNRNSESQETLQVGLTLPTSLLSV